MRSMIIEKKVIILFFGLLFQVIRCTAGPEGPLAIAPVVQNVIHPKFLKEIVTNEDYSGRLVVESGTSALEKQIEILLAEEYKADLVEDKLNQQSKKTEWAWDSDLSLTQIFTWTKGAISRLITSRKREMQTVVVGAAFVFLGASFLYSVSDGGRLNLSDLVPLLPQNFVQSIACNSGKIFIISLCHELGHALVNYAMNGHVSDVYLGDSPEGEYLGIFPGVQLGSIDPYSPAHVKANIADMMALSAGDSFKLKKAVLLEMAMTSESPQLNLRELKNSDEYRRRVSVLTEDSLALSRKKIAAFYAAGPVGAWTSIAAFKVISGDSLMSLSSKDIEELYNLLPWENSDGFNIIARGFGCPDLADKAKKILEKIIPYAMFGGVIGYMGKTLHACSVFSQFPDTIHNAVSMLGNIFRALGIAAINIGSLGMVYIEPASL